MSRKLAREAAMSLLFERELNEEPSGETLEGMKDVLQTDSFIEKHGDYIRSITEAYQQNLPEIDEIISEFCTTWKIDRLGKVDLSILRLAVIELKYMDTPVKVVINECVEMAKKFSSEKSSVFVHGVLASVVKKLGKA